MERIPANEQAVIEAFIEHNRQLAEKTDNKFQAFHRFQRRATPDNRETGEEDPYKKDFEWETVNGRVWHIIRILDNKQCVMGTENQGKHVSVWGENVMCRLANFEAPNNRFKPPKFE